jgi:hypothetical protein
MLLSHKTALEKEIDHIFYDLKQAMCWYTFIRTFPGEAHSEISCNPIHKILQLIFMLSGHIWGPPQSSLWRWQTIAIHSEINLCLPLYAFKIAVFERNLWSRTFNRWINNKWELNYVKYYQWSEVFCLKFKKVRCFTVRFNSINWGDWRNNLKIYLFF